MNKLLNDAKDSLLEFYFGKTSPEIFAEWLYKAKDLESVIGAQTYFELIDLDYSNKDDIEVAKKNVKRIYESFFNSEIAQDWVQNVLRGMLSGAIPLERGCRILGKLHNDGFTFIPIVFVGYDSELDAPHKLDFYRERILDDASRFLDNLNPPIGDM